MVYHAAALSFEGGHRGAAVHISLIPPFHAQFSGSRFSVQWFYGSGFFVLCSLFFFSKRWQLF
jgi:hypothetical protein